jgi:hypothetical protein
MQQEDDETAATGRLHHTGKKGFGANESVFCENALKLAAGSAAANKLCLTTGLCASQQLHMSMCTNVYECVFV